jgi:ABC-2 type transport system ATP-binding protein
MSIDGAVPLQLARVHGGDAQGPRGLPLGRLYNVTAQLGAGVHTFLGRPEDGTVALGDMLTGRRAPTIGLVTVHGREPSRSPSLRRRIGACSHRPALPPGGSVARALSSIGAARGASFDGVLESFALGALASRAVVTLERSEARAVELALALSIPEPALVVLDEPMALVGDIDRARVRDTVAALGDAGCCVVLIASTPDDVALHGQHIHLLDAGELHAPELLPALLRVWLAGGEEEARTLAAALAAQPSIAEASSLADDGIASVTVDAQDLNQAALAVADVATACGIAVRAITPVELTFDALRRRARARRHARTLRIDTQAPIMGAAGA